MREILVLNEVPVEVLYFGGITPSEMLRTAIKDRPKDLVLFVPGNPGIIQKYARFGEQLQRNLNLPTWLIGYGGYSREIPLPKEPRHHENLYDMHAQVHQKKELIFKYLEGISIILIAHSYGCALMLECMKDKLLAEKLKIVYLIFPMFQEFDELPEVDKVLPVLNQVRTFLIKAEPLAKFFFQFQFVRKLIIDAIIYVLGWPKTDATTKLIDVNVIWSFLYNVDACTRMTKGKPFTTILKRYAGKIKIWCCRGDMWQKPDFGISIKKDAPGIWCDYNELGIPHNFNRTHSGKTADALGDMILNDVSLLNKGVN